MMHKHMLSGWLAIVLVCLTTIVNAAPKADLWAFWASHQPRSSISVDHQPWNALLQTYLRIGEDGVHRFAYADVSENDRQRLDDYLTAMSNIAVFNLNRDQQLAYWLNLYNALTIQVVLDHYPVDSIRDIDISPGFFSNGPWRKKLLTIEGQELSLDDIEHRIIRPIWRDPRIHYGVNCAAISCPNLQPVAFTADNVEQQLDVAARAFINDPRGVRFDGDDLIISKIYDWFEEDFGNNTKGVLRHLSQYAEPELRSRLQDVKRIDDHEYDWSLNVVMER